MTHLDLFLQKGPPDGHHSAGLEELRRVVLLDGIPANSDGMVSERSWAGSLTMGSPFPHRLWS